MKLESQVCSLDLAKRLRELGVKQERCIFRVVHGSQNWPPETSPSGIERQSARGHSGPNRGLKLTFGSPGAKLPGEVL
jgi:hypothetical protein